MSDHKTAFPDFEPADPGAKATVYAVATVATENADRTRIVARCDMFILPGDDPITKEEAERRGREAMRHGWDASSFGDFTGYTVCTQHVRALRIFTGRNK